MDRFAVRWKEEAWRTAIQMLWMHLFGTTQFLGIDFGFWVAMGFVLLIVAAMNLVFWLQKPMQ